MNKVESPDGKASLEYVGLDPSRDGGGIFRFEMVGRTDLPVVGRAIVATVTSLVARDYAAEKGMDFDDKRLGEQMSFVEDFAEQYGHTHEVREFEFPWKEFGEREIRSIIESFCNLYFHMISSHENNNAHTSCSESGAMYPDSITFSPYEVDRRFHVKKKAA